jgi:hypothetical protein
MDTLQLPLHTECFRTKAVYGTMNYLVVRHNSRGSEVGFRCLLTAIEALIRLDLKKSEVARCGRFGHFICSTEFHIYNIII